MRRLMHMPLLAVVLLVALLALATGVLADNTDQNNNGSRYAWGENIGWLKARPASEAYGAGGSGVQITDTDVLGYVWGENIGWVNLSCKNDASCAGVAGDWGVKNDGAGHLSGYAWGENVGWINFSCTNNGSCGAVSFGVSIATPGPYDYLKDWGVFRGYAWGENIGWISFNCQNDSSCGTVVYQAQTGWPNSSGDGYTDAQHIALGKDPFVYCPIMRADVDGDGHVSILDLAQVAGHFLETVPPATARIDQDGDGHISILDLATMASSFLQPVTACP